MVRIIRAAATGAYVLFWASVIGFASLRSDYSHLTDAVSELGAVGAPNAVAFNLCGYILPGIILCWCGWQIGRRTLPGKWLLPLLLASEGAALAAAGVFPADLQNMSSATTRVHMIASLSGLLAPVAWIPLAVAARRIHPAIARSAVFALILLVSAFSLYGVLPLAAPVQRLTFAIALGWYPVAAWLLRRSEIHSRSTLSPRPT